MSFWHYPRPDLAAAIWAAVDDAPGGVLRLVGPRRSGKTEFLQQDLARLVAVEHGHRVIYASLTHGPAALVQDCERAEAAKRHRLRLDDWDQPAEGPAARKPLEQALETVARKKRPALILLDDIEADSAAAALIVEIFSHHAKGLRMICAGTPTTGLPPPLMLPEPGQDFVAHQLGRFHQVFRRHLDPAEALEAFGRSARNPARFRAWLVAMGLEPEASAEQGFVMADHVGPTEWERPWAALTPFQRAVARLVAERRQGLFGQGAAPRLEELTGAVAPSAQVRQTAMRRLERQGLVTRQGRNWRIADPLAEAWMLNRPMREFRASA